MLMEIDVFEFTRGAHSAEGTLALASLERLASLLADQSGELDWRLDGWRNSDPAGSEQLRLRLRATANVGLRCGRCLGVARLPLAIDRGFVLARSEAEAEQLDQDEEDLDALVASKKFDVAALLEDEAIMAIPAAPSHAECAPPAGGKSVADVSPDGDARPNPFASLTALKGKRPT